jgi:ABC-2 type transport system permease protein
MGLVASIGRGYLPAVGALSVIIAVAQIAVLFGSGGWFTFAVPGLLAVAGAPGIPVLTPAQVTLMPVVALVSVALTMWWWQGAEVA